jgi:hypothetical protein
LSFAREPPAGPDEGGLARTRAAEKWQKIYEKDLVQQGAFFAHKNFLFEKRKKAPAAPSAPQAPKKTDKETHN